MIGVATVGNASLICFDNNKPIITTDPWFGEEDDAYFGSWVGSYKIPKIYKDHMINSEFIWVSHGHPDHLNPKSIKKFKKKKILISDHYGSRIFDDLTKQKYNITIIPDKKWIELSKNVSVHSITTLNQDSILLVKVKDTLFVNLNDADPIYCSKYIKNIAKNFNNSYLLSLASYGDADMINFYDEDGQFVVPPAKNNLSVGGHLSMVAKSLSLKGFVPFSSHHQYQREDSIWAQEYTTPLNAYETDLDNSLNFVKPFSVIDCENNTNFPIEVEEIKVEVKKPSEFGDNYSDVLERSDLLKINDYFQKRKELFKFLNFINFRVGDRDNFIDFYKKTNKGITFSLPRNSLMEAIEYEIFDDLLIGNFMKTTLHNMESLYDSEFNQKLTKYSDNGRVFTEEQLKKYYKFYTKKSGREFIYDKFLDKSKSIVKRFFITNDRSSKFYKFAKSMYYKIK